MHALFKKIGVTCIVLLFLFSGLSIVSANDIEKLISRFEEESISEPPKETMYLYRHGPDGSIEAVPVEIECGEQESLEENIADMCMELLENDEEIQNTIKNMPLFAGNSTDDNATQPLSLVYSRGRGVHIKFPISFPRIKGRIHTTRKLLRNPFVQLWHMFLIRFLRRMAGLSLFVFCSYPRDSDATTIISPLQPISPLKPKEQMNFTGTHQVTCLGFIGYTGWMLPRSRSGHLVRQGFAGFSISTTVKTL